MLVPRENSGIRRRKKHKIEAPSTREAPTFKPQTRSVRVLRLGSWNFPGAWMLGLGALSPDWFHWKRRGSILLNTKPLRAGRQAQLICNFVTLLILLLVYE